MVALAYPHPLFWPAEERGEFGISGRTSSLPTSHILVLGSILGLQLCKQQSCHTVKAL